MEGRAIARPNQGARQKDSIAAVASMEGRAIARPNRLEDIKEGDVIR